MLTVGEMMTTNLITISGDETLLGAARLMAERRIGAMLVVENSRCAGIFTERDVVRVLGSYENVAEALGRSVRTAMTATPDVVKADDTYITACRQMAQGGYRHLPVVDRNKIPVGILSVKDLLISQVFYFDEMVSDRLVPPLDEDGASSRLRVVHIATSRESRMSKCLDTMKVDVLEVRDAAGARRALETTPTAMVVVDHDCRDSEIEKLLREVGISVGNKHVHRVVELKENTDSHVPSVGAAGDDFVGPSLTSGEIIAHLRLGYRLGCVQYQRIS